MDYLLTNPQKSIWLTEKVYSGTSINNISGYTYIDEDVEFNVLKKAINEVIKLNDSMRIKIKEDKDSCVQYFSEYTSFDIDIFELSSKQDVEKKALELAQIPFEIKNSLLFKFNLFRLPNKHGGFFLSAHHLIGDSWSLGLIVKDILRIYSELKNNAYVQKNSPSYINYINNEKEYINSDKYLKDKAYWDEIFKTVPEVATIPSIKGNNIHSYKSTREKFIIPDNEINKIKEFCTDNKISVYNFFMAIYSLYLGRVSNLDDFVIGTPILNRTNFEQKHTTGMFISTAPLRINLNHDLSFAEFIKQISSNTMSLLRHQRYPYQAILEDLRKKDSNIPNLYNVVLSYQITKTFDEESGIKYSAEWLSNSCCADDLQVHLFDLNDQGSMTVAYEYKTDKYDNEDISNLHDRILTIINQVIQNKDLLLKNIEIVTPEEKHKILYEFNNTKFDYPKNKTIVDLFEEQVEKTPDNIAVVFEDQKLTYKELNKKANQLARHLLSNNISHGDVIGICLQKGLDFIVSIFATLKCGAIYMPIFTDYPKDRINHMIKNSNCNTVITSSENLDKFEDIIPIDITNFNYDIYSKENLQTKASNHDVAYIIYTSGSTGTPKGVQITHQNLINFVFAFKNYFNGIDNKDTFFSSTNIAFDVCIWELFTPLLNGAKLVFNTTDIINDIVLFCNNIIKNNVTALYIPPNILNEVYAILNEVNYTKISKLLVGVESISNTTLNKYIDLNPDIIIINGYGPTETTICATAFNYKRDTSSTHTVSIGKPLLNNNVYILSKGSLCPIGVPGELYVSGDGVGIGYLNDSEKTSASFVQDIFDTNKKMYSTGDIAYWNEDGTLSFIGRRDKQIKLHGYRIELSEIDCVMETHPIISKSLSIVSNGKIINYFISSEQINSETIKLYLKDKLPFYMIPSFFINIDSFPVTINGKIDIKALPVPSYAENTYIAPRNEIENILSSIWCKLFNKDKISITDNFFDLGGDSLVAIKLQTEALKFNLNINYQNIFETPNIKELSKHIQTSTNNIKKINKAEKQKYYPLSSAQTRIYYSSNLDNNSTLYNTAGGIIVDKLLDMDKLQLCFNTLIKRHDALRTCFEIVNGEVVQIINDTLDFKLNLDEANTNDLNKIYSEFIKPFDLSKAPLFRTKLVKLKDNKMLFLLDMHHIISDGTSIGILLQELCDLYNGNELAEKQIDYKDFTLWEKEQFENKDFKSSKEYWVNNFKDEIPLLNMPTTYSRPSIQSFEGSNYHTILSKEIYNKVNNIAKKLNITPYMLMLSCYYILLSKYTSQDDIVIGTPIVGRELPDLSNMLGVFVNTLALRNKIDSSLSFEKFSNIIKNNCLNSFKNQSYPFDILVKDLKINRDTSRNPLFDVVFVYQSNGYPEINFKDVKAEYFVPYSNMSKFDLTLEILPINNEYKLRFEYCTKLFDEEFIQRLSSHYINILNAVLENNEIKIADIDMLSKEERNQILYDFNNIEEPTNNDTFISLFEEQVNKHPNNIALICDDKSLTYSELNKKANSLSHFLINNGIKQNDIVAIMTDRSLETIICMLGILKAGAAFVNMDPTYPIERTTYYLNDCKAKCVLKQKHLNLPINNFNNIYEIDLNNKLYNTNTENPNININLQSLSYIIYTSGSTGTPKGVVLNHIGLANMCKAMTRVLDYLKEGPKHTLLSVTSTPFDIFVYEIVVPLSHGMKIVLANNAEHRNPKLVDALIRKYNTDVMTVTPSLMKINYDNREPDSALALVKNMVFGGEPLSEKFVRDLKNLSSDITIYNIYGPSEITVLCNVQNLDGEKEINIGPPILNNKIYILDSNMNPVPVGLSGEIYIGGIQVGCGYLGKEKLTNEKFIKNPFAEGKMFKSGDIGRWTKDGKLQCLGRLDHQVKLRGLRIELGEIEKILEAIPEVDEAVVNKVIVNDKEALCAYYVLNSDIDENLLKNTLREKLPYYMVPAYFMKLDSMPYSINRKIDRKALPQPNVSNVNSKVVIDNKIKLSPDAQKLLFIWKNVLNVSNININDNFFDIGGDSISAIQVQIEAVKYGINIEYSDIFKYPTIKLLSSNIKRNDYYNISDYNNNKINKLLERNTEESLSTICKTKVKNILVVGTTGYLGVHLIYEYLTKHKGNVYCLIRPKNRIEPEQRLEDIFTFYFGKKAFNKYKKRMIILKGDITIKNMGMSQEDMDIVKSKIDVIINSGALVKHYGEGKLFEDINVLGTQNVVDFCKENKKRLLHISTISVSGNGEKIENVENLESKTFSEKNLYIDQKINGIYTFTKFKAEYIVLNAISQGLDALILRVGNITNRYSDGGFQRNFKDNAFAKRIKSFIEIGAFPEYFLEHEIELTPVDLCSEAIIKLLYYKSNSNVLHIYNNNLLSIKLFVDLLHELNINITPVSNKIMVDKITTILEDNEKKDIVSGIIYDLDNNKNLVYTSNISLDSDFSNKYLSKIGFSWKKINKYYLKRCLKYFKIIGYIDF